MVWSIVISLSLSILINIILFSINILILILGFWTHQVILKLLYAFTDLMLGCKWIIIVVICLDKLSTDVKVPSNWVKINSTKKTIRYHPPEVLAALDKLSLAKEELGVVSRAAWNSFLRDFGKHYVEFQACVQALAALDCLHSLAILSRNKVCSHRTFQVPTDIWEEI